MERLYSVFFYGVAVGIAVGYIISKIGGAA